VKSKYSLTERRIEAMFHDWKPLENPLDEKPAPKPPWQKEDDKDEKPDIEAGEWRRIRRPIYSPFWRGIHNLVAHPLLAIHRPTGEKLHDYTARKMYEPKPGRQPIVTDND
jgi:hypothetical protein